MTRWQGFFSSPNIAGMGMAIASLACSALLAYTLAKHRTKLTVTLSTIYSLAGIVAIFLLALTQSRASWLAFIVALLVLYRWRTITLLGAIISVVYLLICIVAIPGAGIRVGQSFSGDPSIIDRFTLWKSTLALIKDHPWGGVGYHNFANSLDMWYLNSSLSGRFSTALNDALTCAGSWGIPATTIIIGSIGGLLIILDRLARLQQISRWVRVFAGIFIIQLICGLFQANVFVLSSLTIEFIVLATLVTMVGLQYHRAPALLQDGFWGLGVSVTAATILAGLCQLGSGQIKTITIAGHLAGMNRYLYPKGLIIVRAESDCDLNHIHNTWMTALIRAGWCYLPLSSPNLSTVLQDNGTQCFHNTIIVAFHQEGFRLLSSHFTPPMPIQLFVVDPQAMAGEEFPVLVGERTQILYARHAPFIPHSQYDSIRNKQIHVFTGHEVTVDEALPYLGAVNSQVRLMNP